MWGGHSCPAFLPAAAILGRFFGQRKRLQESTKYGYARTSTDDQTTLQLAALKRARCSSIFEDKGISGASVKSPALSRCLKTLRAGDTLTVWKLDRLGRSLRHLITMLDDLRARA
jgi:DNA invertase Pin-like site-specific DNA recombinase